MIQLLLFVALIIAVYCYKNKTLGKGFWRYVFLVFLVAAFPYILAYGFVIAVIIGICAFTLKTLAMCLPDVKDNSIK